GPDFMLALMFYENYAGLYDIVEIEKEDWPLLPEIEKGKESAHLSSEQISLLREKGYIPGPCFKAFDEGGWSATPEIIGADGKTRRILFFHAFKSGQPSLNWTSPTAAASQLINADIVQSLCQLGAGALRLDATPFCGIIVDPETQSEPGSPVSIYTTKMLAGLIRKYGGWSYQELNTPFELVKKYSGSDLYYDFFTRPAIEHAALTGDASFLYIMNELMTNHGIDQKMLIHDTQNHDEITYGIPQLDDPSFNVEYHGKEMPASEVRKIILEQKDQIAVNSYNKGFTDGVATTIAGYLAAGLEVKDIYNLTEREKQKIQELHTLIIFYNAMQPGLFGISGWDMVGALPIPEGGIEELLEDGDTRWHNRGSYDLLGNNTSTENLPTVLPKCKMIYGPVPQQLKKPDSFCSKIKKILSARTKYKIQLSDQVAVIKPQNTSAFISLQRLPDNKGIEISALNFGNKEVTETLKLSDIKQIELKNYSDKAVDIFDQAVDSKVSNGELKIHLSSRSCKALLLESV
ncbi:MAG: hypothetical protein K9L78_00530, partial [Victivallales bacterium]|nr:hypothetical protein [Victivallales bacterium]